VILAHRASYEAFVGKIPRGKLVCHTCDNRWCVNPEDLFIGTDKTNAIDKQRKGRACKKLSLGDREIIRQEYELGMATQYQLASRFGVSQKAVWQVVHRYGAHGKEHGLAR
jgi:hypothetical protein